MYLGTYFILIIAVSRLVGASVGSTDGHVFSSAADGRLAHEEKRGLDYLPGPGTRSDRVAPEGTIVPFGVRWQLGDFVSVQVNVDNEGQNIRGDAANEPSMAIDPADPQHIVIGWRQFDNVLSNFRQAGWGYSGDGGKSWFFPGVLTRGTFRSDPVLDSDAGGNIYYYSLLNTVVDCDLFKSTNGGRGWGAPVRAFGGDKAWMAIDRTAGIGRGNIYCAWQNKVSCCGNNIFTRSTNGGVLFSQPVQIPASPLFGTIDVGPDGEVYVAGQANDEATIGMVVARSQNAKNPAATPVFDLHRVVNLGGLLAFGGPNPEGLLGQLWVATDHSMGPSRGNVYLLGSVGPFLGDPLDVMFARSEDGGMTWSSPVRVNDDAPGLHAWQWFGTMSVAPNGRIDAFWNDTRGTGLDNRCALHWSYSTDEGRTWSPNVAVSPVFNSFTGFPQQNKIGDYYHSRSDNTGANIAYAATFNGEQDVYFLRVEAIDCNRNGLIDAAEISKGLAQDCNENAMPDECEPDCNGNSIPDACDIAAGASEDCNANFHPDECDPDVDADGLPDGCDPDSDNDGLPDTRDACPYSPLGAPIQPDGSTIGDIDADCDVDRFDHFVFTRCFSGVGMEPQFPVCSPIYDLELDDDVDLFDFANFQKVFTGGP